MTALTHVEDYRVGEGFIAVTIDIEGVPPSTVAIEATRLVEIIEAADRTLAATAYQHVLALFVREFRKLKQGKRVDLEEALQLAPFWLALRQPVLGANVRDKLSELLRRRGCAHITLYAARERGVAISVGEQFVDLAPSVSAARELGDVKLVLVERIDPSKPRETIQ